MKRAIGALLIAALAVLIAPRPPSPGDRQTGDPALAQAVRQAAENGRHRGLSVALIENGQVRTAGIGTKEGDTPVDAATPYEIGSVAKAMTGMLLADSGIDPRTRVRELLPHVRWDDPAVGDATLEELSSHRAGLPRDRVTPWLLLGGYLMNLTGRSPYGETSPQGVLDNAAAVSAGEKGEVSYSNLGAALLGQALAAGTGTSYPQLLKTRLLDPLGMTATVIIEPDDPLPAGHATGFRANGLVMDPWRDHGYGPAGGAIWSTAADLAKLVKATMEGSAPGSSATTPRFTETSTRKVGYGWFTSDHGKQVTWHNGGTGGFRAFVGYDRAAGRGVVVLGNTDTTVDPVGLRLLGADPSGREPGPPIVQILVTLVLVASPALSLLPSRRGLDRRTTASDLLWSVLMLMTAWAVGSWEVLPPVIWALGVGLLAYAAIVPWKRLPYDRGRPWRWASVAVPAALIVLYALL
ncbi:MAG: beta-lactamase family protein [Thermoactinospora sp.]|nr:beta-lactamase family protein [Thermoactinospora sp.]